MKNILYPQLPRGALPRMLLLALAGSLVAGAYGILHDQVTYTLSPEYFTKFKFEQFAYARPAGGDGAGDRAFVLVIGFLATWWVGMIAGWVLGRIAIFRAGVPLPLPPLLSLFGVILGFAVLSGVLGFGYGTLTWDTAAVTWAGWQASHGIEDLPAFARVGHMHNFGYLGALLGLITAAMIARRKTLQAIEEPEA